MTKKNEKGQTLRFDFPANVDENDLAQVTAYFNGLKADAEKFRAAEANRLQAGQHTLVPTMMAKAVRHKAVVGRIHGEINLMLLELDATTDVRAKLAAARDALEEAFRLMAAGAK